MRVQPSYRERALVLEGEGQRAVVIGDVHIGLEQALARDGLRVPDQTPHLRARVEALLHHHRGTRLVVVGDLKETIGHTTNADARKLRAFMRGLGVPVDLVPGNHDADLGWLGVEQVTLHPATGIKLGDVALTHGHTWPDDAIMDAKLLVTSHHHPMLGLRDELGKLHKEPCWVKGPFRKAARARWPQLPKGAHFIIMPAFNELLSGHPITAPRREASKGEGMGPLLGNQLLDLDKAKVWTLDGIEVGTVAGLRAAAKK